MGVLLISGQNITSHALYTKRSCNLTYRKISNDFSTGRAIHKIITFWHFFHDTPSELEEKVANIIS